MDLTQFHRHIETEFNRVLDAIGDHIARWSSEDAEVFSRRRKAVLDHVATRISSRSARGLLIDINHWVRWLNEHPHTMSPLEPEAIGLYLEDRRNSDLSRYTIAKFAAALLQVLKILSLLNQARANVLFTFQWVVKAHFPRATPAKHAPTDFLERFARYVDPTSLRDIRDLALMTLLKETMARPAEILGLRECGTWLTPPASIEDLRRCPDGSGRLIVQRPRQRMKPGPQNEPVYVSAHAMRRLEEWFRLSGLSSGPLFRKFPRGGQVVGQKSLAMTIRCLTYCIKRACQLCGINSPFTPSSLRSAMVNDMLEAGVHPDDVRRAARLSKVESIVRMHRGERTKGSAADVHRSFEVIRELQAKKNAVPPSPMPQTERSL